MFILLAFPAMAADKYPINGDLSYWGVNLQKAYSEDFSNSYSGVNGWIPHNHATVDWVVENNIDPTLTSNHAYPDWTGYSSTGTHMKGTGDQYTAYIEPIINSGGRDYVQPAGGEAYDMEAVYFDDDNQNMYLAIVTSMPIGGSSDGWKMGDIAIDINQTDGKTGDAAYEYGIKTRNEGNNVAGSILYKPTWTDPASYEFPNNGPYTCSGGTLVGSANLVYKQVTGVSEQTRGGSSCPNNYVIEASIPKSAIGNPSAGQMSNLHVTVGCGNDEIELSPVTFKSNIPEFPSIALPVAAIMGMILILGRRNKK